MNCEDCVHEKVCEGYSNCEEVGLCEPKRPHGKWEHWGSPFTDDTIANSIVCTRCKARYVEIDGEVFNFCPNCGADMRIKDELNRVSKELNSEIEKSKSEIVPEYRDGWRLREGEAE